MHKISLRKVVSLMTSGYGSYCTKITSEEFPFQFKADIMQEKADYSMMCEIVEFVCFYSFAKGSCTNALVTFDPAPFEKCIFDSLDLEGCLA